MKGRYLFFVVAVLGLVAGLLLSSAAAGMEVGVSVGGDASRVDVVVPEVIATPRPALIAPCPYRPLPAVIRYLPYHGKEFRGLVHRDMRKEVTREKEYHIHGQRR